MANAKKGEMTLQVDGENYILEFSHGSLILLEEKLDKGIMRIMKEMESWSKSPEDLRLGTIRALLWAGLHKHQPNMTMDDAAELIGRFDGGLIKVVETVAEAFSRAFSAPETKATHPTQKASNGTGTPSGSSTSVTDTSQNLSGPSPQESTRSS